MNQQLLAMRAWWVAVAAALAQPVVIRNMLKVLRTWLIPAVVVLMSAYIVATALNTAVVYGLVKVLVTQSLAQPPPELKAAAVALEKFNYFKFSGAVLQRHLFNSAGEFPHDEVHAKEQPLIGGDCKATSLELKLVGTIIHDNPAMSVATVIDKKMKVTDVYRSGDGVIDYPAVVLGIEKGRLILEVAGSRECLEISDTGRVDQQTYRAASPTKAVAKAPSFDLSSYSPGVVTLKDSYVEEQLGEGFVKIIQSSRFVPHLDENGQAQGFKIFGIKPNTLFKKIGLQDNDVIHQVNQTSLKNVEQGFALYQALQDESEVVIGVMRKGEQVTVKVQIEE